MTPDIALKRSPGCWYPLSFRRLLFHFLYVWHMIIIIINTLQTFDFRCGPPGPRLDRVGGPPSVVGGQRANLVKGQSERANFPSTETFQIIHFRVDLLMEGKGGLYKVRDTSSPATSPSILYPPQIDLILLIPPLYPLSSFLSSSQPSLFREDPFWPFPRVSFASPLFPNFHHFIFILVEILLMQSMLVSVIRDVPIFNPPLCVELCCFPLSNVILFLLQETEKKEKEVEEQQRQQDPPPQPYAMAIDAMDLDQPVEAMEIDAMEIDPEPPQVRSFVLPSHHLDRSDHHLASSPRRRRPRRRGNAARRQAPPIGVATCGGACAEDEPRRPPRT